MIPDLWPKWPFRALFVASALIVVGCSSPDAPSTSTDFDALLAPVLATEPEAEVAIAWRNLRTSQTFLSSGNEVMHAASTMKLAVMIEAFRRVDAGHLAMGQGVIVTNTFKSIIDGSAYQLEKVDDSETSLYDAFGETRTVLELVHLMVTKSSNLATNILMEWCGPDAIQKTIESLGVTRMKVLRGVQDLKAFDAGRNNVTTARDLMVLLEAIAKDQAASKSSCEQMRKILLDQAFNELIPAGLPRGIPVAHKTGSITAVQHDAAIVLPKDRDPYVLVVLTRGLKDEQRSARLIAEISRVIWSLQQQNSNATNPRIP
ncbi:MAG TPA: class A beta-lactamase-related serine hydrolase [Planctomycetota bacterium]|nr:class A beta-lactamase-related serine hydrolase [Planctomycetota bacterium]